MGFFSPTGSHVPCYTASDCKAFWEFSSTVLFGGPFGGIDDRYPLIPQRNGTCHPFSGAHKTEGRGRGGGKGDWDWDWTTDLTVTMSQWYSICLTAIPLFIGNGRQGQNIRK